jgi:hypothetical protein
MAKETSAPSLAEAEQAATAARKAAKDAVIIAQAAVGVACTRLADHQEEFEEAREPRAAGESVSQATFDTHARLTAAVEETWAALKVKEAALTRAMADEAVAVRALYSHPS